MGWRNSTIAEASTANQRSITIIAAVGHPKLRTRLEKFVDLYVSAGYTIDFWGWDRDGDAEPGWESEQLVSHTLLRGGGYANRRALLRYPLWMVVVFVAVLRHRPRTVHALGMESALPAVMASVGLRRRRVVFDDADRFSLCFAFPDIARQALQRLERVVSRRSHVHIIPSRARYPDGLPCARTAELPNTPSSMTVEAVRTRTLLHRSPQVFTVYANGWIGDPRGANLLDALCRRFDADPAFELLLAGRLTGPTAEALARRRNVRYLGVVSAEASLACYAEAHVATTFYDPAIPINRHAEANKWGDCMIMQVPFIVNQEVTTAQWHVREGHAFAVPYGDPSELVDLVRQLRRFPERLERARCAIRRAKQTLPFDVAFQKEILPHLDLP